MFRIRETNQDPFKDGKIFVNPLEKNADFFSFLMKGALSISLLASIALIFFTAFSNQSRWFRCQECNGVLLNSQTLHQKSIQNQEKTNLSHILFGIGGSTKTWEDRRHYSELWWIPNVTRGFVWFDETPKDNETWWPQNLPPYRVSEDSSRFKYTNSYGSRSAVRIARIVLESFRLGLGNVRWFVMGDDDTVFFTENIVSVLAKYDHNLMYYIGGNSESVEQDLIHSYGMAYGGGGFAISYPLAAELVKVLDGCIDRYSSFYGSDERISACMAEIGVSLTKELGFHQVDIRRDPYGLLAAHPVAPLASLHHLDSVNPLFPNGGTQLDSLSRLMGAYKMDPGRTLQQSFCYDLDRNWSISVSWGYTAQIYTSLLTAKELQTPLLTFQTWKSWRNEPFTFNTRPMNVEPCERPVIYFLDRVFGMGDGEFITTYTRFKEENGSDCDRADYVPALAVQSINVSSPKLEQDYWTMAPRRQCCDIVNPSQRVEGVLQIKIRKCNPGETVTLP